MMTTTAYHYKKLRTLEEMAANSGMKLRAGVNVFSTTQSDILSLVTHGEHLPIYTRDVELMSGSAEELIAFIIGWQKSSSYLQMLGATTKKTILRKEQDYRNRDLTNLIKKGKRLNDE
jgi:hypothetical protein